MCMSVQRETIATNAGSNGRSDGAGMTAPAQLRQVFIQAIFSTASGAWFS